ncbi:MAG: DNA polymerase [Schwartzia sp.]|nr:DNA polymerase [Schwartzia sp. (in: firmicutes)]
MKHLSIDIETFSSEPIAKTGLYKYVQSSDFEVLLFAYSVDGAPVEIIDLAQGEELPAWLGKALLAPEYVKHAYNAAFEWYCLSKFCGRMLPVEQWRDTMLHGLYCGFTAGLDATGKALGLPADKQKMSVGKALIRYFCVPCNPTKANGGRTRNYPKHDPAKWNLFKEYCRQDVATEMEIEKRLSSFPVPEDVEKQWQTDLIINARGVAVDMEMVRGALEIDGTSRAALMEEAVAITGLQNPNSIAQLAKWVEETTGEALPDLRKDTVEQMLKSQVVEGSAKRMLEIRQELGKTSTKKYDAIEAAVCRDGRVRGLLQFYGANRTGRWAGRLVQVQNLPRTYIGELPLARNAVKKREADKLKVLYGSVPDTLSQLIRTSFIADKGHKLVDADFSSIEARVIAWLAQEHWVLDVFKTHGKIYEATASQMFGVPMEKIKKGNPEYALRQRGKVATLALGYQGGVGALVAMGALNMGIPEEDLQDIVYRWRDANKRIVELWYKLENAAVSVIQTGGQAGVNGLLLSREFDLKNDLDFLTITLPSKRKLYYAHPSLGVNQWDRPSIAYRGVNQTTKRWEELETYGGKLVENVVQAIARDCLAQAIEKLEAAGFPIVFHVHDEVVIDCEEWKANLDEVVRIMTEPIPWAKDLPLNADGWVGDFFRKD